MVEPVVLERVPPMARITISRPESKNAINLQTLQQLLAALSETADDAAIRVVVLRGAGGDFSAGGDIRDMVARRGQAMTTYERLRSGFGALVRGLTRHPKPVTAAVDGVCLGAGAGVALACDAVLATNRATFGFPFVKIGLVPDTGVTWILPRVVGYLHARRLLLTGETLGAAEAHRLGLVSRLVDDAAALEAEVAVWTQRFAAIPPTSIRDTKSLLMDSLQGSVDDAVLREAMVQGIRLTTDEHANAADAFLAKRGPPV